MRPAFVSKCREPNFHCHTQYPRRTDIHTAVKTDKLARSNFSTYTKSQSTASNKSQNYSCCHNFQVLTTLGCDMTQLFACCASCRCMVINSCHRQPDLYIKLLTVARQGNSCGYDDFMGYVIWWTVANTRCREDGMKMIGTKMFRCNRSVSDIRQGWYFKF
jgi:hypothetical protein